MPSRFPGVLVRKPRQNPPSEVFLCQILGLSLKKPQRTGPFAFFSSWLRCGAERVLHFSPPFFCLLRDTAVFHDLSWRFPGFAAQLGPLSFHSHAWTSPCKSVGKAHRLCTPALRITVFRIRPVPYYGLGCANQAAPTFPRVRQIIGSLRVTRPPLHCESARAPCVVTRTFSQPILKFSRGNPDSQTSTVEAGCNAHSE